MNDIHGINVALWLIAGALWAGVLKWAGFWRYLGGKIALLRNEWRAFWSWVFDPKPICEPLWEDFYGVKRYPNELDIASPEVAYTAPVSEDDHAPKPRTPRRKRRPKA